MARLSYVKDADLTDAQREVWTYFTEIRQKKPSDTHRIMAHAPGLLQGFLALSDASQKVSLSKRDREFITMVSAWFTGKEYVWAHHWDRAIRNGVDEELLRNLGSHETHPAFSEPDRAMTAYMEEAIASFRVSDATFQRIRALFGTEARIMEFMMVVAFTCFTSFIHGPVEIDVEEKYAHVPTIAALKSGAAPVRQRADLAL